MTRSGIGISIGEGFGSKKSRREVVKANGDNENTTFHGSGSSAPWNSKNEIFRLFGGCFLMLRWRTPLSTHQVMMLETKGGFALSA